MALSINRITAAGEISQDPRFISYSETAKALVFTVKVSEFYKDKEGQMREFSDYIPVRITLPRLYEEAQGLRKGDLVYIEGCWKSIKKANSEERVTELQLKNFTHVIQCLSVAKDDGTHDLDDTINF